MEGEGNIQQKEKKGIMDLREYRSVKGKTLETGKIRKRT